MTHKHLHNDSGIVGINQNTKKINELVDAVNSLEENVAHHESTLGGIIEKIRMMWGRNALIDLIDRERYLL